MSLSKRDLVAELIDLGHKADEISKKKKKELVEIYEAEKSGVKAEDVLENVNDEQDEKLDIVIPDTNDPPKPTDHNWTQFVLNQLNDDEMDNNNPRVDGLRRISQELVGTLVEEGCDLVCSPSNENGFRACAKAWLVFMCAGGVLKRFEALADACTDNIPQSEFGRYLVAMADTRAKGRCFRSALCLKRVVAAEELGDKNSFCNENDDNEDIDVPQVTAMKFVANAMDVSLIKFMDFLGIDYELNNNGGIKFDGFKKKNAKYILQKLHELRSSGEVPKEVKNG